MKIKIFTTGGSIDKFYSWQTSRFEIGEPQIQEIFKEANVNLKYTLEKLIKKDSLDFTKKDRCLIYQRIRKSREKFFVITHGTDTMVETAKFLSDIQGKVIVLTGSMKPAKFKDSDAAFNVGTAIAAVQTLSPGVYIAMSGRVFPYHGVRKNRKLGRFESI